MQRAITQSVSARASSNSKVIIDCFAGVGGNTIAFAKSNRWDRVYALESDAASLECAKHNAEIYGVAQRISWHLGDCFDLLKHELRHQSNDSVLFASPPWGGQFTVER